MYTITEPSGIVVKIVADSSKEGCGRVTSFLLTYPRFIHAEIMTHRVLSRNAASSRAIPIHKVIRQVWSDPAMPVRWGANGKGMQDHGVLSPFRQRLCRFAWKTAAKLSVVSAWTLGKIGVHKQLANRVMEPFVKMTALVTGTDFENFFALRVHKAAQPELQKLAFMMLHAYIQGPGPTELQDGEWHVPFGDDMPQKVRYDPMGDFMVDLEPHEKIKVAVARAARTSYLTIEGKIDVEKDFKLHDDLANDGHWSAFEHVCRPMVWGEEQRGNLRNWRQYRHLFAGENRRADLIQLYVDYLAEFPEQGYDLVVDGYDD